MKTKRPELLSACIILASLVLCMAVGGVEYASIRREMQTEARQAAASVSPPADDEPFAQLSDPLLVVVDPWIPLPKDWQVTPRLVGEEQVDLRMYDDLMEMFRAAGQEGVWFWVASGYRSVEEQQAVLDRAVGENLAQGMTETDAEEEALKTIAKPGFSEHHTGLAVDLNQVEESFAESEAYAWLQAHAAEYGFIQRYPAGKEKVTGIQAESWHYRYVGPQAAQAMEHLGLCLEEYVAYQKAMGVH